MSIKLNWGHGIVIGMTLFMSFIITLTLKMVTRKVDLVSPDYYEQGIAHDKKMTRINATTALSAPVQVEVNYTAKMLEINFPEDFVGKDIEGEIKLFRSADASKDVSLPISGNTLRQAVPLQQLDKGNWRVIIQWTCGATEYYAEEEVVI